GVEISGQVQVTQRQARPGTREGAPCLCQQKFRLTLHVDVGMRAQCSIEQRRARARGADDDDRSIKPWTHAATAIGPERMCIDPDANVATLRKIIGVVDHARFIDNLAAFTASSSRDILTGARGWP